MAANNYEDFIYSFFDVYIFIAGVGYFHDLVALRQYGIDFTVY